MNILNENFSASSLGSTSSLDALINSGGTADRKIGVLVGHNLGHNTLILSVPMHEFFEISEVANEINLERGVHQDETTAQRPLDRKHAEKLAVYLLKGLANAMALRNQRQGLENPAGLTNIQRSLGKSTYMALQPIVANIRGIGPGGSSGLRFEREEKLINVYLATKDVLWVVDGQHRREAMRMLFEYLRQIQATTRLPKRPALFAFEGSGELSSDDARIWMGLYEIARTTCTVTAEVHLGLDSEQERQLFHDLNNLGKSVESSMAFDYDSANPINSWIKKQLIDGGILRAGVVDKDVTDWRKDTGAVTRKDLIGINSILFLNKTNASTALPKHVEDQRHLAIRFWQAVSAVPGFGQPQAKHKTVIAQAVVLKALAKLVFDMNKLSPDLVDKVINGMSMIDFNHTNLMWRYYELDEKDQGNFKGLKDYLPAVSGGNRDVGGKFQDEDGTVMMRFGAKHNDIYPIIGDMIRWRLELPNRHSSQPNKSSSGE
jgi:hypothetical protein